MTDKDLKSRSYNLLCGITKGKDPTEGVHLCLNMYRDYDSGGEALESIPGYRKMFSFDTAIHNMLICDDGALLYIHAGDGLFCLDISGGGIERICSMADRGGCAVADGGRAFFSDGERLVCVKGIDARVISTDGELCGCRVGNIFDGRLFLGGNPELDGVIFYTTPISDGDGEIGIGGRIERGYCRGTVDIVACASRLAILWRQGVTLLSDSEGYPAVGSWCGITPTGGSALCDGRLIVLSDRGLVTLGLEDGKIEHVGEDIDTRLSSGGWKIYGIWCGYLLLSQGDELLLGDTRSMLNGGWYLISPLMSYRNDRRVFRYCGVEMEGIMSERDELTEYAIHEHPDEICAGEPTSTITKRGETIYYSPEGEKKYLVYPTAMRDGGIGSPAVRMCTDGRLLIFGTECGDLCIFNNDRRSGRENYGTLPADQYSFDNHSVLYAVEMHTDDCGAPDMTKLSEGGLWLAMKCFTRSSPTVSISYDGQRLVERGVKPTVSSFDELDFGSMSGDTERFVPVKIPERVSWCRRRVFIHSREFCSPFGISAMSFRYRLHRKTK